MGAALIWCPFGDKESARQTAEQLLNEGLIACANILPAMHSIYVWRGERGESAEIGVLIKTESQLLDSAIKRLEELHPYDAPAITGWYADCAGVATLDWLNGVGAKREMK